MREDVGIRLKRRRALAHARAVAVAQGDHRRAGLAGELEDLDDLLRLLFADRAVHHGKVLRNHIDRTALDGAAAGHDAGIREEHALLHEAAAVQQQRNALARGQLAALLLFLDASGLKDGLLAREHLIEIL